MTTICAAHKCGRIHDPEAVASPQGTKTLCALHTNELDAGVEILLENRWRMYRDSYDVLHVRAPRREELA